MTDGIAGALLGAACTAGVAIIGAAIHALLSVGRSKERLDSHQEILGKHQQVIEKLPENYVPRTELVSELTSIKESGTRTERWVEFLVKKEAVQPESH